MPIPVPSPVSSRNTNCPSLSSPTADGGTTQLRKFSVFDVSMEKLFTDARPVEMQALAKETGGMFLRAHETDELLSDAHRMRAMKIVPGRAEFVWDRPWIMVFLLIGLGLEWMGRRAAGWY